MSYWVVKCEEHDPYFYLSAPGEGSCWARTPREARAFVRKVDAQRAIDKTPGLGQKARPVHMLTRADIHRREVKRLRKALIGLLAKHPHRGSCCTLDATGKVIVTPASCRCNESEKAARAAVREVEDRHSQLVIERDRLRMVLTAIASQSANPDIAAIAQTALSEGKEPTEKKT